MSGYREGGFDPAAFEQPGGPLRPYNWVQWAGVGLIVVGVAMALIYALGRLGWMSDIFAGPLVALGPILIGQLLINSRRAPGNIVGSEQLRRNRRMLLITTIAVAAILGFAAVIEFTGA